MKNWLASTGAVMVGIIVTVVPPIAMDAVMFATGLFPTSPAAMPDPLFAVALAYRALFTIAGGYATARFAPNRPLRNAWILAGIGLVAGLAGVVAYYVVGGVNLGPAWYAISIPLTAIPCVWLGARLALARRPAAN